MITTIEIKIKPIKKAKIILLATKKYGLPDVETWVSKEKLQLFLDWGINVAFGAFPPHKKLPVGVIVGGLEEEGRIWIEALAVNKKWRKKGIARALVNEVETIGKKRNYRAIFVDVDDDNLEGLSFYFKIGFKEMGQIKQYYYDKTTALILMKPIIED